jgi:hypothetical protein
MAIDMLAIASFWGVSLAIVNPIGDFPLNDDWSYGLTVKHLIEKGDFRPMGWTSMPLITHALWGSLFCIPAGFSFNALRLSTLTMSLLGVLGAYLLIMNVCQSRWVAAMVALTLGFNPIYYSLSNTFMTDVLFAAITILASVFFVRCLRTDSNLALLTGTTLAVAATLSRQLGISIPLAFAVSMILRRGIAARNIGRAAIPAALCVGALWGFQHWLSATGRLPALYYAQTDQLLHMLADPGTLIRNFAHGTYIVLLYMGWFLSPILLLAWAGVWVCHKKKLIAVLTALVGVMVVRGEVRVLHGSSPLMPVSSNIIDKGGIGPFTLPDTAILNCPLPALPPVFWLVMTTVSLAGAALLITALGMGAIDVAQRARLSRMNDSEAAGIFFLLSAMIYLLPLVVDGFLDRYLLPLIPLLAGSIASISSHFPRITARGSRFAAVMLLGPFLFFSICGTRDYLEWNRVRWKGLNDLMESKQVKAEDIDGGLEFNGLYDPMSVGWVRGDNYLIAFRPVPGYILIKEYNYRHWMPRYAGKVVVLQKNPLEAPKR